MILEDEGVNNMHDLFADFLIKARKKHGDKFDYSKFMYINSFMKSIIICPIHGEFEQTPVSHLNSKYGCKKCYEDRNIKSYIEKASELHDNKYDYSKFLFKNLKSKSTIICPIHGEFEDNLINHLNNAGCHECLRDKLRLDFIKRANEIHGNKFNYQKFVYVNAKIKSVIICPSHGEFEQTADKHLNSVNACPKCESIAKKIRSKIKSKETLRNMSINKTKSEDVFIKRAENKYGDKFEYNLDNYNGLVGNKINIKCRKHGWFKKQPYNFLICTYGCNKCWDEKMKKSKTKTYNDFLEEANSLYGNKYVYPNDNRKIFKNRESIIKIECKKHGLFSKMAQKHLSGQGCFPCKIEELVEKGLLPGGYNEELFKNNRKIANKKAYLYYLKINDGKYYKIGITTNLKRRMSSLKSVFCTKK